MPFVTSQIGDFYILVFVRKKYVQIGLFLFQELKVSQLVKVFAHFSPLAAFLLPLEMGQTEISQKMVMKTPKLRYMEKVSLKHFVSPDVTCEVT